MQVCNAVGVLCGYNPLPLATLLTSTRCAASMHLNWAPPLSCFLFLPLLHVLAV